MSAYEDRCRKAHKTRTVLVWVDVDEGIAALVEYLQTICGIRTYASCQGGNSYGPQVMVSWQDDFGLNALVNDFDLTILGNHLAYVHPRPIA